MSVAKKHIPIPLQLIRFISLGLAVYIAWLSWAYYEAAYPGHLRIFVLLMMGFNGLILLSLVAASQLREWGRRFLVILGVVASCYMLMIYVYYPNFISLTTVFIQMVMVVFYDLPRVRYYFKKGRYMKKRILVVDDDIGVQKIIQHTLQSDDLEVLTAGTGEEGLKLVMQAMPDLIILDVILPGIKGRDVCTKIKQNEETKHIPVVFLTFKESPDDIKAELEAGALGHLTKPINPQQLIEEVKKMINRIL